MQTEATDAIAILFINNDTYKSDTYSEIFSMFASTEFIGESVTREKVMFY